MKYLVYNFNMTKEWSVVLDTVLRSTSMTQMINLSQTHHLLKMPFYLGINGKMNDHYTTTEI